MAGVKGQRSGGHNRKSVREKQIKGERKDRMPANLPDRIAERCAQFEGLGDIGTAIWRHYEPMLYNNGTLSGADAIAFQLLCKGYEEWHKVAKKCDEEGRWLSVETSKDPEAYSAIKHSVAPWARQEIQLRDQLMKACREFGITPVARGSVEKIVREKKVNPLGGVT